VIEILRRVVLVAGVYGAIVCLVHARPVVVEAEIEDFAARQARRPAWSGDREKPLEEFIRSRTEGFTVEGRDAAWASLRQGLVELGAGQAPEGRWVGRAGVGRAATSLFLRPDEEPVASMDPSLGEDRAFLYARVPAPEGVAWIGLTRRIGREADGAPRAFLRPLRPYWWGVLLATLLLYVFLPHRRRGAETLAYSRARACVGPDVTGLLLGGTFFTLALFVIPQIVGTGELFVPAAWPGYLLVGLFLVLAWVIHGWAAWYDAFRLDVTPDGLRQQTLLSDRQIAFANVREARLEVRRPPKWLRRLLWVATLLNPRAAGGQAFLMSGRADAELVLEERSGRRTRLRLTALRGAERVKDALENARIEVLDRTEETWASR
jgi:hypothetical protein